MHGCKVVRVPGHRRGNEAAECRRSRAGGDEAPVEAVCECLPNANVVERRMLVEADVRRAERRGGDGDSLAGVADEEVRNEEKVVATLRSTPVATRPGPAGRSPAPRRWTTTTASTGFAGRRSGRRLPRRRRRARCRRRSLRDANPAPAPRPCAAATRRTGAARRGTACARAAREGEARASESSTTRASIPSSRCALLTSCSRIASYVNAKSSAVSRIAVAPAQIPRAAGTCRRGRPATRRRARPGRGRGASPRASRRRPRKKFGPKLHAMTS